MRPLHWLILILVILILFGAQKLPEISRSIAQSLKIFKSEMNSEAPNNSAPTTSNTDSSTNEENK